MGIWATSSKGWSALGTSRWVLSMCGHNILSQLPMHLEAPETPVFKNGQRKRHQGRKWGKGGRGRGEEEY